MMKKQVPLQAVLFGAFLAFSTSVWAQAMPWEGPICKIAKSFSGPVAVGFVVLAVVLCGAMLAFGELNGVFKSLLGVAIGGAMAVGAVQWTEVFTGAAKWNCVASIDSATSVAEAGSFLLSLVTMAT